MTVLLAIDPSKPGGNTGVAWFRNGSLFECGLWNKVRAPKPELMWSPDVFVCERQYVRPPDIRDGSAELVAKRINDLLYLLECLGQWQQAVWLANYACEVFEPTPVQWKGSVPKEIHNARVLARLSDAELRAIPKLPKSKLHNVIDAIGLGLWALGRMTQERKAG